MKHLILTRHNYNEDYPHLEERKKLIEKYTKKSLENQTSKNFTWCIVTKHPVYSDIIDIINFKNKKELEGFMSTFDDVLLTSRVDNDDILSPEYVESVQEKASELINKGKEEALIDSTGYRWDKRVDSFYKDFLYESNSNSPFLSVLSRDKTCWHDKHGHMSKHFENNYFISKPLWIQIIHQTNKLMNRVNPVGISNQGTECEEPEFFKEYKGDIDLNKSKK